MQRKVDLQRPRVPHKVHAQVEPSSALVETSRVDLVLDDSPLDRNIAMVLLAPLERVILVVLEAVEAWPWMV